MNFDRVPLYGGLILLALALPADAQAPPDIFSKPADGMIAKENPLPYATPGSANLFGGSQGIFNAGKPLAPFDHLPTSAASPAQTEQWQKFLSDKKKWALMTPEEIMGLPTPEKILGLPGKDDDKHLTLEQKFLARQDERSAMALTNNFQRDDYLDGGRDALNGRDAADPFGRRLDYGSGNLPKDIANRTDSLVPRQSAWGSAFNFPAAPPKPTPEQLAGMERFRELLNPAAPPATPVSMNAAPVVSAPDPYLQAQPQFNPLGRTAAQMLPQSYAGRPSGITPLPTLTHPYAATPVKSPEAKLPPWLSSGPNSVQFQQRKF